MDAGDQARQWAEKIQSATNEMERVSKSDEFRQESGSLLPANSSTGRGSSDTMPPTIAGKSEGSLTNPSEQNEFAATASARDTKSGNKSPTGSADRSNGNEGVTTNREALADQGSGETDSQLTQTSQGGQGGTQSTGGQFDQQPQSARAKQQPNSQPPPPTEVKDSQRVPLRREGRNWAIPKRMVGMQGNAIVRTIRIECHSDHFVMLASGAAGSTEVFGFTGGNANLNLATLQLAAAVRERIERWGPALPGGRWEPQLQVIIMPGGERRYSELQEGFRGSGIEVTGRRLQ